MYREPKVTVLMSVYNGERFLSAALESILHQTWTDFEFLIINDGSTDGSREIILSYDDPRIRLVDNPTNIGLTKSLNRGLELARGALIARQDADDLSHPARLEKQVNFMDHHPEVALLGARHSLIDDRGCTVHNPLTLRATTPAGITWQFMLYNPVVHSAAIFRKEVVWTRLGGYDESLTRRQDFELWSRIAVAYGVANLPEILVKFRVHPGSVSANYTREDIQKIEHVFIDNLRRYLDYPQVPPAWVEYLTWMLRGKPSYPIEMPANLLTVITAIWQRFLEINPPALEDRQLHSLLACDLVRAALILAPRQRWASLKAFSWAFREDRGIAFYIAAKYLSLLLLGEPLARSVYFRLQSLFNLKR